MKIVIVFFTLEKSSFRKLLPLVCHPCPKRGGGSCDTSILPELDTPTKIAFIKKKKLWPPRGALRGGGKHLNGGMGASAPIIYRMEIVFFKGNNVK
ncbi:MAG: hypothetical protein CVV32_06045 [Methanomicrobiales archaeon HGW-Methanomicrobiales-3]|nr:MAG: hypothetical protein CVV32_06045 [Methanomicrobiales archaeon HGW-Methanomicrobiales-3]